MNFRQYGHHADHYGRRSDGDRGSASLWVLSMAMVLWVCLAGVVLAAVAVIARHRAATAADMAALGAASVIARSEFAGEPTGDPDGGSSACAIASAIALANDALLTSCHVTAQVVDVTTSVQLPALGLLGSLGLDSVSARARAGPG